MKILTTSAFIGFPYVICLFVYVYSHVNSTILINSNVCGVREEVEGWGTEEETAGLECIVCRGMSSSICY